MHEPLSCEGKYGIHARTGAEDMTNGRRPGPLAARAAVHARLTRPGRRGAQTLVLARGHGLAGPVSGRQSWV
jgi:hypothetical protein